MPGAEKNSVQVKWRLDCDRSAMASSRCKLKNLSPPGIVSLDSVPIGSYFAQEIHDFSFRWFSLTAASRPSDVHNLDRSHSAGFPLKTAENQPSLDFAIGFFLFRQLKH